jgi:hypothetical protein
MQTVEQSALAGKSAEEEQRKVRAQLERLLDSHQFRNSRRYPALLRFIVEETLEGRGDLLKERLIGIHVFQRPPDYDTAADPIVRVNIAEVRKRIAQYYHAEEHDAEIRIELTAGRYAPEFRWRRDNRSEHPEATSHTLAPLAAETGPALQTPRQRAARQRPDGAASPTEFPAARRGITRRFLLLGILWVVLLVAGSFLLRYSLASSALDEFWAPIVSPRKAVLLCLPNETGQKDMLASFNVQPTRLSDHDSSFLDHESLGENVVYSDMLATLNIVNVLDAHHTDYRVRLNVTTSLDDLMHGPAVLIGGLDNDWTLRAVNKLPYKFFGTDEESYWIASTRDPGNRRWSLDLKQKYTSVTRDYALIARVHNEQTGEPQVSVAGIGMSGTAAAGDMLADEHLLEQVRRRIGAGFRNRDFEVVISTDVVNGMAGTPQIIAVSVW